MKSRKMLKDQSGMVLVLALMMTIVLTLIVITATETSIFESKLSGNKRAATTAFFAAESGIQTATANITNFNFTDKYVNNKYDPFTDPDNLNPTKAKVIIEHDTTQSGPPRGTGMSAINFEFEHFVISGTGKDETESGAPASTCTVEEKVIRILPTMQGGY